MIAALAAAPTPAPGVVLSLATGFCWALSPFCWSSAGRKIGSFNVVLIRTLLAALALGALLPLYVLATGLRPEWPSAGVLGWLALSAFTGVAAGDALGFEAILLLGPRRATQIAMLAPVFSVALGWLMGEHLTARQLVAVALVIGGTLYAVLEGSRIEPPGSPDPGGPELRKEHRRFSWGGVVAAAMGAALMAAGAVSARRAFQLDSRLDPFAATALRVGLACVFVWAIPVGMGKARAALTCLGDRHVASRLLLGTVAGPVVGMTAYVTALKLAPAGLVSTLAATSPLFMLPMVALHYRSRIGLGTVLATLAALAGVAVLCLK